MVFDAALTKGSLKSLAAQYVYVFINLNKDPQQALAWRQEFSPQAKGGIPQVHVVRWDGKTLHDDVGGLDKKTMAKYLTPEYSGVRLTAVQLAKAKEIGDKAEKLLADGKTAKAVETLAKVLGSNAAGEAVARIDEMGAKLLKQAKDDFATGSEQLQSEGEAVDGALMVLATLKTFGKFPGLGKQLSKDSRKLRRRAGAATYFRQAGAIIQARASVAKNRKSAAIASYKAIVKKYPDSRAAEIANEALALLSEG